MYKKRGFTLTEVLLATLVVGLIGIALASLTTAASREGGVGRSRVMLRNSMSRALRQLRQDVHASSRTLYVRNSISDSANTQPLLLLGQNLRIDGNPIYDGTSPSYILYCFQPGAITTVANGTFVEPHQEGDIVARDGGRIYRFERNILTDNEKSSGIPVCNRSGDPANTNLADEDIFLENVKFIPRITNTSSEYYYPVPLFARIGSEDLDLPYNAKTAEDDGNLLLEGRLKVNFILELPSSPVVNDAADEEFMLPIGYFDSRRN